MSRTLWAIGATRDDVIAGNDARGHIARFSVVPRRGFVCVKCAAPVDTCELFCRLHLWTFDNPVLRDAGIFS